MKMNIVICDDDEILAKKLENMINKIRKNHKIFVVSEWDEEIFKEIRIDLVFMDIELKDKNGIDYFSQINKHFQNLKVIFMSSYPKYSQDIFECNPAYFLLKPIKIEKLTNAITKVETELSDMLNKEIIINNKDSYAILKENEIVYVASDKRKLIVNTSETQYEIYDKLDKFQLKLSENFCRCHQSYIVNLNYVKYLETKGFILFNKTIIPISQKRYSQTKNEFVKFVGDKI